MATIRNQGQESIQDDLAALFATLQDDRVSLLQKVRDVQTAEHAAITAEAQRLEQKTGKPDPRVAALNARAVAIAERIAALDVEIQIAAIRTPSITKTDTLVQGRITNETRTAAGRMRVRLVDENGRPLKDVAAVETDDSGYYAFVLNPEQIEKIGANQNLSVRVEREDANVVPSGAESFVLKPGAVAVSELTLTPRELDRLNLRAGTTPAVVTGAEVPKGKERQKKPPGAPAARPAPSITKRPAKKK
jgi:hypothetical protein